MSTIMPEGEGVKKAIKWISAEREEGTARSLGDLINEASIKFDLSPADAGFLLRFFTQK